MTTTATPADTTTPAADPASVSKKRRPRRIVRAVGVGLAAVLTLSIVSIAANAVATASEKAELAPYGQTVTLDTGGEINVSRTGGPGPTMVLLSGYGTPAPALDFAPLIRELDAFDVIVVEGFGYGYSDLDVPDRTIENITSELKEVLAKLRVDEPVILAGHSVGGLYARYYANAYPDDVAAVIGIDPMAAKTASLEVGTPSVIEGVLGALGLYRAVTTIAPDLIQPPGTAFTHEERRRIAALSNWNYGNPSIADEWSQIEANSTKAAEQPFAADLPVLEMLSSESVETTPTWLSDHEAELEGVTDHELEVLEGAHYLQWTQSPAMARIITEFVAANVNTSRG
jgi:pimeloyl-ACP methyl ester carboxylesterase